MTQAPHRKRLEPPTQNTRLVLGSYGQPPARASAALALVVILVAPGLAAAEPCPYPLGDFVLTGDFGAYGPSTLDPEWQIVDAVRVRPQYSFGQVGFDGQTLHLVFESETSYIRWGTNLTSESHIIAYKEYSAEFGWNTARVYPSSDNVSLRLSEGGSTQPTMAIAGGGVWLAWQVSGWINGSAMWPENGTYILLRGKVGGQWTDRMELSPFTPASANRLAKAQAVGSSVFFAYQTNAGQPNGSEFRIVGRMWDGRALGPLENISHAPAGWSDETVQLASQGGRVAAVWASRDLSDIDLEGHAVVRFALREANGTWSAEQTVSPPERASAEHPAIAFTDEGVAIVWSTNDAAFGSPTERDIVLRGISETGNLGETLLVNPAGQQGEKSQPAITTFNGRLHVLWVLIPPAAALPPTSTDVYYRNWSSAAFGDTRLVSETVNKTFPESWPGFFTVEGALHAFYISDVNTPATGKLHDNREMTRLLERGPRAEDGLNATLKLDSHSFLGSGSINATVSFYGADGAPALSDHFALVLGDGTALRLPPGSSKARVVIPYHNNSFDWPGAAWCGKSVPLSEATDPPAAPEQGLPFLLLAGLAAAVALVGAAAWVARRRGRARDGAQATDGPSEQVGADKP